MNHPSLLTLPPHLREKILAETLIEPDPLPAYLLRRTVRRRNSGEHTSTRNFPLSHCIEAKVFPSSPPVLQTCRLLRREGFSVWIGRASGGGSGGNVFLFLLGPGDVGTVEKWVDRSGFLGWLGAGSTRRGFCFVCEFLVEDSWDEGDVGASVVTEWDFGEGTLELGFGGALVGDCTCDLEREGRRVSERLSGLDRDTITGFHRLEMEGFFGFLEAEVRDVLTVMNRKMSEQGRLCQMCGKPRWQREWA